MNYKIMHITGFLLTYMAFTANAACRDDIISTSPDSFFNVSNNGTAVHKASGLMWMRCSLGTDWDGNSCSGIAKLFTWVNALVEAENYTYAGYDDWRLPNKNELESIIEERCYGPAINSNVFPNTAMHENFWTSSPRHSGKSAWSTDFVTGYVGSAEKYFKYQVRLVRSIQQ